jgi:hypothetical protein
MEPVLAQKSLIYSWYGIISIVMRLGYGLDNLGFHTWQGLGIFLQKVQPTRPSVHWIHPYTAGRIFVLIYYNLGFNFFEGRQILPYHIDKRDLMSTARLLLETQLNIDYL